MSHMWFAAQTRYLEMQYSQIIYLWFINIYPTLLKFQLNVHECIYTHDLCSTRNILQLYCEIPLVS